MTKYTNHLSDEKRNALSLEVSRLIKDVESNITRTPVSELANGTYYFKARGKFLSISRKVIGKTIEDVSIGAGVATKVVLDIENGTRKIYDEESRKICDYLCIEEEEEKLNKEFILACMNAGISPILKNMPEEMIRKSLDQSTSSDHTEYISE